MQSTGCKYPHIISAASCWTRFTPAGRHCRCATHTAISIFFCHCFIISNPQTKIGFRVSHLRSLPAPNLATHGRPSPPQSPSAAASKEQPMKQNGSLCSVIVGNLALVSLATQTWFVTEDEERLQSSSSTGDSLRAALLPSARRLSPSKRKPSEPSGRVDASLAPAQRHCGSGTGPTQNRATPSRGVSRCSTLKWRHLRRSSVATRTSLLGLQEATEGARPPPSAFTPP